MLNTEVQIEYGKIGNSFEELQRTLQETRGIYVEYEESDTGAGPIQSEVLCEDDEIDSGNGGSYYARYELTAYIWTGNPCADGVYPEVGYTVASNDPNLWHRWIYIDGYGTYFVHDTGGMAINVIDIFYPDYESAIEFGRREADIYILD